MTARPRRTTTLVGPNRLVLGAATAGLVALASAGTALLVLTGTSSVAPIAAPAPPLPSSSPPAHPGVVVLPARESTPPAGSRDDRPPHRVAVVDVAPAALAFTDGPAPVAAPDVTPPVPAPVVAPVLPALRRAPAVAAADARPGRHLAKGHAKHGKHPKLHGKRVGWSHSVHRGNR